MPKAKSTKKPQPQPRPTTKDGSRKRRPASVGLPKR